MAARLHVLVGAGGVGKTTLSAAYGLALSQVPGAQVGLLSIDPAHRLQSALGATAADRGEPVPGWPHLRASMLDPSASLRRWVRDSVPPEAQDRVTENPFFIALAERLATASDLLAAVRIAEWRELDPNLTDLVVDTAPGLGALDFLRRPERLTRFLESRLALWLRHFAPGSRGAGDRHRLRTSALRILGGLEHIGGEQTLIALADLLVLGEIALERMALRLSAATAWLHAADTELVLVAAVREDAVDQAEQLSAALGSVGLRPHAIVLNRTVPAGLERELQTLSPLQTSPAGRSLIRYAAAYAAVQDRVLSEAQRWSSRVICLGDHPGLDGPDRLGCLARLGAGLQADLLR